MSKFLSLAILIIIFSNAQAQTNCSYDKAPTEAIEKLAKLAGDNMYLRIIVYHYEFHPFQRWPEKQDLLTPADRLKGDSAKDRDASKKIQKTKALNFYKIVFRIDNYKGMFNKEDLVSDESEAELVNHDKNTYVFKDAHQNTKIKKLVHVHSLEEKASLEIKSKEMNLNIEFYMGPKKKMVKNVHELYDSNYAHGQKKEAYLIHPDLEMGYGEPLTYHIFMYLKNNARGGQEPKIEADNEVNKALKEIIESSEPKSADGKFRWERKEKIISNVRDSFCTFLKSWIEPTSPKTIKVDFYKAVQYVLKHPGIIFSQKPEEGDTFGFQLNNFDFPPHKFKPNKNSTHSALTRKLFDKYFKELRKSAIQEIDKDGESDDLQFLNRINLQFKKAMKANFQQYRDQKGIHGNYQDKAYNLDATIHQVQRTAKETDANEAVFKTYHIGHDGEIIEKDG